MLRTIQGNNQGITAEEMYTIASKHYSDLGALARLPLLAFFGMVAAIPFRADYEYMIPVDEEIARPAYLLDRAKYPGLDCKKKSILLGAYAEAQVPPIEYRFIGVQQEQGDGIHHIFVQFAGGPEKWINADATFPGARLGAGLPDVVKAVEFERVQT